MKSKDNFYTYTIGDNEYELIVLNNIKYSLKAYPINLLFKTRMEVSTYMTSTMHLITYC